MSEKGQKYGWIFGGLGALLWILILAIVLLFQKNYLAAFVSSLFFAIGVGYIFEYAPWKFPDMPFWKIYLGLLLILIITSLSLFFLWYPGELPLIENLASLFFFIPLFIPIAIIGKKSWREICEQKPPQN